MVQTHPLLQKKRNALHMLTARRSFFVVCHTAGDNALALIPLLPWLATFPLDGRAYYLNALCA